MKKKLVSLFVVSAMCVTLAACGEKADDVTTEGTEVVEETVEESTTEESVVEESTTEESIIEESTTEESVEESTDASGEEPAEESSESQAGAMDNFDVAAEDAAAFGAKVKEAVAAKDLEAFADLIFFPTYVGFKDGGVIVETRDAFIELGADRIFTEELLASVAAADENNLSASRAGFILTSENGGPNVIFGTVEGNLAVTGMNY